MEAAGDADSVETALIRPLSIYGFMDAGWSQLLIPKTSFLYSVVPTRANTMFLGNLNLFVDAQPSERWRSLLEVRFTNSPRGHERSFASAAGTEYERVDNRVTDHGRNEILTGSSVIERAWIEWSGNAWLNVRVGQWLTPWGIWNRDHGTPTLISLILPDFQLSEYYPRQQLGVNVHGREVEGAWEFGYHATISNGRTPGQTDPTHDKALGARLYASRHDPSFRMTLGLSGYRGRFVDYRRVITSFSPFLVETEFTVEADEWALGADLALDRGRFRLRAETAVHRVVYAEGKRQPAHGGAFQPNHYELNGYLLAAYRLPWWGLEPYLSPPSNHSWWHQAPSTRSRMHRIASPRLAGLLSSSDALYERRTNARYLTIGARGPDRLPSGRRRGDRELGADAGVKASVYRSLPMAAAVALLAAAAPPAHAAPDRWCSDSLAPIRTVAIPANGKLVARSLFASTDWWWEVADRRSDFTLERSGRTIPLIEVGRVEVAGSWEWALVSPVSGLTAGSYRAADPDRRCLVPIRVGPADRRPPRWTGDLEVLEVREVGSVRPRARTSPAASVPLTEVGGGSGTTSTCPGPFDLRLRAAVANESPLLAEVEIERIDLDPEGDRTDQPDRIILLEEERVRVIFPGYPGARYRARLTPVDVAGNRGEIRSLEFMAPGWPCPQVEYGGGFRAPPQLAAEPSDSSTPGPTLSHALLVVAVFLGGLAFALRWLLRNQRRPDGARDGALVADLETPKTKNPAAARGSGGGATRT